MSTSIDRHIPLNPRDFLILMSLSDGELHGYGMMKEVETHSDGQVTLDPANLYRALKRLIAAGLLAPAGRRPAADARDERRRYYAITPVGRQVLEAEAHRLDDLAQLARARKLITNRRRVT